MKTEHKTVEDNVNIAIRKIFDRPDRPMSDITHTGFQTGDNEGNSNANYMIGIEYVHEFSFTVAGLEYWELQEVAKLLGPCESYFEKTLRIVITQNPEPFGTGVRVMVTWKE